MSVVPVKSIPTKSKHPTVKSQIENDIRYAMNNHIYTFEFVSDDYNYKYLASYAKECFKSVFHEIHDKKVNELVELYGVNRQDIRCHRYYRYVSKCFSTKSIELEDRIHVYATINMNAFLAMYADMTYDAQEAVIRDYVSVLVNDYVRDITQSTTKTAYKVNHISNITKLCIQSKVKTMPLDTKKIKSITNIYLKEKFKK